MYNYIYNYMFDILTLSRSLSCAQAVVRHAGACIETMQQDLESPRTRHPKERRMTGTGMDRAAGKGERPERGLEKTVNLRMPLEDGSIFINYINLY